VAVSGGGRHARGIGEPIWAARTPAELVECQRHETLLNLAFAGVPAWWLLCPYDTGALGPDVLEEAEQSHPYLSERGAARERAGYRGLAQAAEPFAAPLPDPPIPPAELGFGPGSLAGLRELVSRQATAASLDPARTADLVLAVDEVATNSLRHGGRGLWMVNQLCDLVQLRSFPDGAAVRVHVYLP
jgi:hypothetical protein